MIKTIPSDYDLSSLILLNDGRICTNDCRGNVKIYEQKNFDIMIEMRAESKDDKFYNIYENNNFNDKCLGKIEDNLIFFKRGQSIYVVEIINSKEYKIKKK